MTYCCAVHIERQADISSYPARRMSSSSTFSIQHAITIIPQYKIWPQRSSPNRYAATVLSNTTTLAGCERRHIMAFVRVISSENLYRPIVLQIIVVMIMVWQWWYDSGMRPVLNHQWWSKRQIRIEIRVWNCCWFQPLFYWNVRELIVKLTPIKWNLRIRKKNSTYGNLTNRNFFHSNLDVKCCTEDNF